MAVSQSTAPYLSEYGTAAIVAPLWTGNPKAMKILVLTDAIRTMPKTFPDTKKGKKLKERNEKELNAYLLRPGPRTEKNKDYAKHLMKHLQRVEGETHQKIVRIGAEILVLVVGNDYPRKSLELLLKGGPSNKNVDWTRNQIKCALRDGKKYAKDDAFKSTCILIYRDAGQFRLEKHEIDYGKTEVVSTDLDAQQVYALGFASEMYEEIRKKFDGKKEMDEEIAISQMREYFVSIHKDCGEIVGQESHGYLFPLHGDIEAIELE
ncbi:hypothetical protein Ddc_20864 [Ditylenchus destructor]|nr:hypothetical protein Ddc_20864 [Ditylenchus destructor]